MSAGLLASVVCLVLGLGSGSDAMLTMIRSPKAAAMPAPNWSTVKKEGRQATRAAWPPLALLGICILIPSLPERRVTAVGIAERLQVPLRLVEALAGKAIGTLVVPNMHHADTSH